MCVSNSNSTKNRPEVPAWDFKQLVEANIYLFISTGGPERYPSIYGTFLSLCINNCLLTINIFCNVSDFNAK